MSVSRGHAVEQVAEALDIGVVQRRIDFVEHADRRRIGQEQSEDQGDGGQRLLAARQQGQRRQPLARRLGHDLQPGLERIVALDQLEMRLAAVEQGREQAAEMAVDLLIGFEQPDAAFAVEAADRAAQAVDRLGQFLALPRRPWCGFVELGQLLLGDQVDRADPFALGGQALEAGLLLLGIGELGGVEAELLRQQRRRAFEPLEADAGIFGAAGFLRFGAGGGGGAAFAGFGGGFVGRRRAAAAMSASAASAACSSARGLGRLRLALRGFAFEPLDFPVQPGRLVGELLALRRQLLGARPLRRAGFRPALAPAPLGLLAPGSAVPFAVGGGLARPARRFGALVGDGIAGRPPRAPGRPRRPAAALRVGQGGQRHSAA